MRIAIDLEGVIADSNEVFPRVVAERYGIRVPHSFQYQWNLVEAAKHSLGITITPAEHEGLWLRTWELWDTIPEVGVLRYFDRPAGAIQKLRAQGHQVTILTHSFNEMIEGFKKKWIDAHLEHDVPVEWVNGTKRKEDYDFDVFVDDGPHFLTALKRAGKKAYCFDQPWNKGLTDEWYVERIHSLGGFHHALRRLQQKPEGGDGA